LECDQWLYTTDDGRAIRFLGTVRWSDFDVFGPARQAKAIKAAGYFQKVMQATCEGQVFDAQGVRAEALASRAWLQARLNSSADVRHDPNAPPIDATVVITHFAPSLRSADPRYGTQPTTASFCNDDEDLIGHADLWIHGHVHWRSDYTLPRRPNTGGASGGASRVVCQARGLLHKGETEGFDPLRLFGV
jgi:hypothetical protein